MSVAVDHARIEAKAQRAEAKKLLRQLFFNDINKVPPDCTGATMNDFVDSIIGAVMLEVAVMMADVQEKRNEKK